MNKLKLLMAFAALFICAGTMYAADEDYTDRITNANLASTDGWTLSATGGNWSSIQGSAPSYCIEAYAGWGAVDLSAYSMKQNVTLPSGKYRAEGYAFYRYGLYADTDPSKSYARFVAGDFSAPVVTLGGETLDGTLTAYPNSMGEASTAFTNGYYKSQVEFAIESESTIEFGYEGTHVLKQSWFIAGPIKLYRTGDFDYSLYQAQLEGLVADAKALQGKVMKGEFSSALDAVILKYDGKTCSSVANYNVAYAELNPAISNASSSIANYAEAKAILDAANIYDSYGQASYAGNETISAIQSAYDARTLTEVTAAQKTAATAALAVACKAQKQPADGCDMTPCITNPDFNAGNYDGWKLETPYGGNCAIQGGSRMEYWAGNSSNRALASFDIYQELTNLPQGAYTISADMYNSLNGEGGDYTVFSPTCGVYGSSSNEEVALVTEEGTTLKTYTTGEVLVYKGHLRIGTKNVTTPMAARWFLFDNVKLTYARQLTPDEIAANKVPESIKLDQTSVNMTIYGTATLVPTILPEDATDKTITWTTSNPAVATVDNGVVTAVSVGQATITATANGADGIFTTATITVSDVTPVAAPSYYSEIAAGDFYIMNAATGKFLGGANDWGTHASIIEHGIPFTIALSDGKYTLDSHTYNDANNHFLNGAYVDGLSNGLYIIPVEGEDGKYTISSGATSGYYSAYNGSTYVDLQTVNPNSTLAQWYFISKKDRDKMLAAATNENPADATYYIKEANISRNLRVAYNTSGWTNISYGDDKNQTNDNFNAQVWNGSVDVYQTIENIPNGTYTLNMQGFSSGSGVKLYANDVKVDVLPQSGISSQSAAAPHFAAKEYTNTLTVTVTDRTLKIGLEGDCSASKWLCYDNFELFMTAYTANTGVTASVDKAEIEAGQTAQVTAATNPADASFNAITFASEDETIATVDENGVVTGVGIGSTNIIVTANEMENFSESVAITVTAVTPTALAFDNDEITLNKENPTATLTVVPTPDGANTSVTWQSSDETIATVADGVVTAVSTGTATITATSTLDASVTATATVTVTFPETDYAKNGYTNDGATRTVYALGDNIIKNGAFEYPNTFYGWTVGTGAAMSTEGFEVKTEEDNTYVKARKGEGGNNPTAIKIVWPIENGKTYVFGYKVKGENAGKSSWTATSLTNTIGTETSMIEREFNITTDWQEKKYTFTNTEGYAYLQFFARWYDASFDDFYLAEATTTTEGNVDYVTAAIPTGNIGTGAFQYSQANIEAANALVQGEATVADVQAAYEAVTTVNAPDADQLYNLVVATKDHAKENNAVIIIPGTAGANNPTGYALNANFAPNKNLNQAVKFTKVSGNNYNISFETAEGTAYLTYGKLNGSAASWSNSQIQATTDAEKKGEFRIAATATDNVFNIYNTITNTTIACQNGGNIYTEAGNADFTVAETTKPSITINTTGAGWGTVMLPFAVAELPVGVKAYTCGAIEENKTSLTLVSVDALEANKPYIIEGEWNAEVTGDALGAAERYTEGLLTGTYAEMDAIPGTYVLQKHDDVVGFYKVEDVAPKVTANHAYFTAPVEAQGARAFFLTDSETTGIDAIKALTSGEAQIFNANGVMTNKLQKGMNIIKANGKTMKVMVK